MKKTVPNSLKEHKESKIIQTKADKIIFTAAVAAYAIGDEIAELGKVMPLNTLLNAVYEDIKAYLSESEGV